MFKYLSFMKSKLLLTLATLVIFGGWWLVFSESDKKEGSNSLTSGKSKDRVVANDQDSLERADALKAPIFSTIKVRDNIKTVKELNFSDLSDLELIENFESSRGVEWISLLGEMRKRLTPKIVQAMMHNVDQRKSVERSNESTPLFPEYQYPVARALLENLDVIKDSLVGFITSNSDLKKRILCTRILLKMNPQEIAAFKNKLSTPIEQRRFDDVLEIASSGELLAQIFPIPSIEK